MAAFSTTDPAVQRGVRKGRTIHASEVRKVKVRQRYARAFGALMVALAASGALADLAAQQQAPLQRGQTPGPRFLVPILKSGEAGLGRQAGEAIRERMGDDFMLRALWIIPKSDRAE